MSGRYEGRGRRPNGPPSQGYDRHPPNQAGRDLDDSRKRRRSRSHSRERPPKRYNDDRDFRNNRGQQGFRGGRGRRPYQDRRPPRDWDRPRSRSPYRADRGGGGRFNERARSRSPYRADRDRARSRSPYHEGQAGRGKVNDRMQRPRSRSPYREGKGDGGKPVDRRTRSPPRGPRGFQPRGYQYDTRRGSNSSIHEHPPAPARPPRKLGPSNIPSAVTTKTPADVEDIEKLELEPEDKKLATTMGFFSFTTTKNLKIPGNKHNYGVYKQKKIKYRQYMNREKGFNRPLSPV